jgi:N-carbamoyl-L-amino-acid hydrolase
VSFARLWESLLPVGRVPETGGYRRYAWTDADLACREWFWQAAAERGLRAETDRNGNLWAWWDPPARTGPRGPGEGPGGRAGPGSPAARPGAIVTGSHLDSVPDGGAYDGPLGVAGGFAAIDALRERGCQPARPLAVAAFCEEEGARFGVPCLGSRLLAGAISPEEARGLRDPGGVSLAEAMSAAGADPGLIGPDEGRLASITAFVELHIEQGRALAGLGAPVGVAERIWPHGRWRLDFAGRADHAGTTRIADRRDPMLPFAVAVLTARSAAARLGGLATIGKVATEPTGANAICAGVHAWLDARAPQDPLLQRIAGEVREAARRSADVHGVRLTVRQESASPEVVFDPALRDRIAAAAGAGARPVPRLETGAGHDAGVLASRLPSGMIFVRNPAGISHAPAEHADPADCEAGVAALAAALEELACR